jgi:hypothetical protein
MFNGSFENSLRGGTFASPNSPKSHKTHQHGACKGTAHGTGNYVKDGAFQRTPSKRYNTKPPIAPAAEKTKSASVSSEGFSESDSLDSLGEKSKAAASNGKNLDVSSRLYNSTTKASAAKTAKMRHLDIFDVEDASWTSALRKDSKSAKNKSKKSKRKENLKKVLGDKLVLNGVRKSRFRKLSKVESVDYGDVVFVATNKKFSGFFRTLDRSQCLKSLTDVTVLSWSGWGVRI